MQEQTDLCRNCQWYLITVILIRQTDTQHCKELTLSKNFRKEKVKNKMALQEELGLESQIRSRMMIGIVSRLTDQKGFDLIDCVMDETLPGCGSDRRYSVPEMRDTRTCSVISHGSIRHEGFCTTSTIQMPMSHKIYASCDAFLMPSLFEPCGLSQLMSLRYGTLPIVRETGGLKDTVEAVQ